MISKNSCIMAIKIDYESRKFNENIIYVLTRKLTSCLRRKIEMKAQIEYPLKLLMIT